MIHWFYNLIYGSVPVEFSSSFTLPESIERLRKATVRSVFLSLHKQSAVGTVTEQLVSLQRIIPMVGNSFKPFFIGRFEMKNGRVVMVGRFTTIWFVKAFMTLSFGFCILWILLVFFATAMQPESEQWWFPLFGIGMLCCGVALVQVGKWFSRNDAAWLSNVIQSALSGTHK